MTITNALHGIVPQENASLLTCANLFQPSWTNPLPMVTKVGRSCRILRLVSIGWQPHILRPHLNYNGSICCSQHALAPSGSNSNRLKSNLVVLVNFAIQQVPAAGSCKAALADPGNLSEFDHNQGHINPSKDGPLVIRVKSTTQLAGHQMKAL